MADSTYTIIELAREFGLTTRAIRFYEDQGLLAPSREVIVPVDESIAYAALAVRFPRVRFVPVSGTAEMSASHDPGIAHEAIDLRRAAGIAAARAPLVALTDEHARPRADWCAAIVAAHAAAPHAAIGGAVENARDRALNWAL